MFGRKKPQQKISYDPQQKTPVIHASICNGEQVAGFKNKETGHFTEVSLIRGSAELEDFKKKYGITEITKEY